MEEREWNLRALQPGDLCLYDPPNGSAVGHWLAFYPESFGGVSRDRIMDHRFSQHSTALVLAVRCPVKHGTPRTLFICEGQIGMLFGEFLRRVK